MKHVIKLEFHEFVHTNLLHKIVSKEYLWMVVSFFFFFHFFFTILMDGKQLKAMDKRTLVKVFNKLLRKKKKI